MYQFSRNHTIGPGKTSVKTYRKFIDENFDHNQKRMKKEGRYNWNPFTNREYDEKTNRYVYSL